MKLRITSVLVALVAVAVAAPVARAAGSSEQPQDAPQLAFVAGGQLRVVNLDGSDLRSLGPATGDQPAAWSPRGDAMAVATPTGLVAARLDGSDPRHLTSSGADRAPSWSPDGARLVFERATVAGQATAIYTVAADGTGDRLLVDRPCPYEQKPVWSPSGTDIAYLTVCTGPGTGAALSRNDGSGARRVSSASRAPAWSPDGRTLAVPGNSGIDLVSADGSYLSTLARSFAADQVAWSPDGTAIAF